MPTTHQPNRAFTLVELVVVMGIIALLAAMLMPAFAKARAAAESIVCLANLRSIAQAMQIYVSEQRGYLPGSASTSARHIWREKPGAPNTYDTIGTILNRAQGVVGLYDFIGPLASIMQLKLDIPDPDTLNGVKRLEGYRKLRQFACPANRDMIAMPDTYGAPVSAIAGPMNSYCTATGFMLLPYRNASYSGKVNMPAPNGVLGSAYWTTPVGYVPKITKIGQASGKIFLADSGRLSGADRPPVFQLGLDDDHLVSMFTDFGPFWGISKSYSRAATNGVATEIDPRLFAYRHGTRKPFDATGQYRMNAVFYDGHAESLTDMESANPNYWLPSGTVITTTSKPAGPGTGPIIWPDVAAKYLPNLPYVVP